MHQTESLDSNVPVTRLRGGAHRINYFWYHNWYVCNDDNKYAKNTLKYKYYTIYTIIYKNFVKYSMGICVYFLNG